MKKKIIAFGASNSKNSINKMLANYTAKQIENSEIILLDLNDFEMPIYGIDRETETGIPQLAQDFKAQIENADGVIISFAEHNGMYTAAFKNISDWVSRADRDLWTNKSLFLLATSPGARGAKTVLEFATNSFGRTNKKTVVSFSLPSFHDNFSETTGIKNEELNKTFKTQLEIFSNSL